jgi:hypothetical protein
LFVSIIFYIKSGFSVFNRQFFLGGKIWLVFLFLFIIRWGLGIEEFLIEDDLFSLSQDYKSLDIFIFFVGWFLFRKLNYFFSKSNFILFDYFWISRILNLLGKNFYKIGLELGFNINYYFDYFFVKSFNNLLLENYKFDFYLKDTKNFWYLIVLVTLLLLFY